MMSIKKQEAIRTFVENEVYTCQSMLVEEAIKRELFSWGDVITRLGEIPAIIVDPNNLVLPSWIRHASSPAAVIHIDHHKDMDSGAPTRESLSQNGEPVDLNRYAEAISVAGFISAGIFYNAVGAIYWYDPRK